MKRFLILFTFIIITVSAQAWPSDITFHPNYQGAMWGWDGARYRPVACTASGVVLFDLASGSVNISASGTLDMRLASESIGLITQLTTGFSNMLAAIASVTVPISTGSFQLLYSTPISSEITSFAGRTSITFQHVGTDSTSIVWFEDHSTTAVLSGCHALLQYDSVTIPIASGTHVAIISSTTIPIAVSQGRP